MGPKNWKYDKRRRTSTEASGSKPCENPSSSHINNESPTSVGEHYEPKTKKRRQAVMNIGDVKGNQAVFGTCDIRHDRQATAELIDILCEVAETLYPLGGADGVDHDGGGLDKLAAKRSSDGSDSLRSGDSTEVAESTFEPGERQSLEGAASESDSPGKNAQDDADMRGENAYRPPGAGARSSEISLEESIRRDLEARRAGTKSANNRFVSVNTTVKGVIMVCVKDSKIDVIRLVDAMFDEIRTTGKRRCRFLERVTPMAITAYADFEALKTAAKKMIEDALPPVAEGVPPIVLPQRKAPTTKESPTTEQGVNSASPTDAAGDSEKNSTPESSAAAGGGSEGGGGGEALPTVETTKATTTEAPASEALEPKKGVAVTETNTGRDGSSVGRVGEKTKDGENLVTSVKTADRRYTFRVDPRRRNTGLARMDLINALANSAGEGHCVTMKDPEVTIVGEAVKSVVGASVLFNFEQNYGYSIARLQDAVCGAILAS